MKIILWIVLAMIAYDLSIHMIFLFKKERVYLDRKLNYWPEWNGPNSKHRYQQFWTTFWGTAAVLLIIYIVRE